MIAYQQWCFDRMARGPHSLHNSFKSRRMRPPRIYVSRVDSCKIPTLTSVSPPSLMSSRLITCVIALACEARTFTLLLAILFTLLYCTRTGSGIGSLRVIHKLSCGYIHQLLGFSTSMSLSKCLSIDQSQCQAMNPRKRFTLSLFCR